MALMITEECINCSACIPECPNTAIYEPSDPWELFGESYEALNDELTYIVPDKCTECVGHHDEPQCVPVCPSDCIVKDPNFDESEEDLLAKKEALEANS